MAQRIPEPVIEDIRQKANILDIVGQYVQLRKQGRNYFGLCPFHEEKTPSFSVAPDKQIFHCFSCGRGGNVFKFIMDIEDLSFPEYVAKVAEMIGEKLPDEYVGQAAPADPEIANLRKIHTQTADFFHHILVNTKVGETALAYLHERGMADELINDFNIGFAPATGDVLWQYLHEHYDDELLRQSGLFNETDDGHLRDRFYNRVMFPVRDQGGQVVAFSGRILTKTENAPKYLNSPETKLFAKRDILFNLDQAKSVIRDDKRAILFEGFMDVISAFGAGVKNGVASMGTSLTDQQIYDLRRITDSLVICYDGDAPGIAAAKRALSLLADDKGFNVSVVVLPAGMDPDEFVQKRGAEAFRQQLAEQRLTRTGFGLRELASRSDLTGEAGRADFTDAALAVIAQDPSPVERDVHLRNLSKRLDVDLGALQASLIQVQAEMPKKRPHQQRHAPADEPAFGAPVQTRPRLSLVERTEQDLLGLMLAHPEVVDLVQSQSQANFEFVDVDYQALYLLWQDYLSAGHSADDLAGFNDYVPEKENALLAQIEMRELPADYSEDQIDDYLHILQRHPLHAQLQMLQQQLRQAHENGDGPGELAAAQQIIAIQQRLKGGSPQQ
ncbi:MAG: DNA primase [Schleiferilactobacillus perolens]|uniref:DNA primase n=1 Tax=Schleiferilactobacillus perolens TaxID=100468 RepID=UPI0039E854E9